MNKQQKYNWGRLIATLATYGITCEELDALLKCERAIQRWEERRCNGEIEEDDNGVFWRYYEIQGRRVRCGKAPNKGLGAENRAQRILESHGLTMYIQGDCRGCMLYAIRPGDIPANGCVDSYYNRGIAICI